MSARSERGPGVFRGYKAMLPDLREMQSHPPVLSPKIHPARDNPSSRNVGLQQSSVQITPTPQLNPALAGSQAPLFAFRLPCSGFSVEKIRAADAKEVGLGKPAEETYCPPESNLDQTLTISWRQRKTGQPHTSDWPANRRLNKQVKAYTGSVNLLQDPGKQKACCEAARGGHRLFCEVAGSREFGKLACG
jgi:hypothetical protein